MRWSLLVVMLVSLGLAFAGCKGAEEKKEEGKKEEKAVEKKAEEPAAEDDKAPTVKEGAAEEPKAEEKAEEPKAEEKAEEPKAEEKAEEPKAEEKAEEPKAEVKKEEKKEEPKAEEKKEEPAAAPAGDLGAKETIETALKALQTKDLTPIFAMFPAKYIADIEGLVHGFANAMDKEVFDKSIALTERIVKLLVTQKDGVVKAVAGFGIPAKDEDIKKAIDAVAETWALLKTMGLTDLEKLKTFSFEKFAKETAPKLVKMSFDLADTTQKAQVDMFLAMLSAVQVEQLETVKDEKFGDAVVISVNMAGDTEKVKMVKVDGKWTPLDLAKGWDEGIEEAKKGIAEMAEELPKAKAEIISQLVAVEAVVGQIEKTGDLNLALQALGMGMMPPPDTGAVPPALEEKAVGKPEAAPPAEEPKAEEAPKAEEKPAEAVAPAAAE